MSVTEQTHGKKKKNCRWKSWWSSFPWHTHSLRWEMAQVTWSLTLLLHPQVCLFTDSRKDQLRYPCHIYAILTAKSRSWAKRKIKNSFLLENWILLSSQFCKFFLLRMKRSGLRIADRRKCGGFSGESDGKWGWIQILMSGRVWVIPKVKESHTSLSR